MSYNPFLTTAEAELFRTQEALRQQQERIHQSSRAISQRFVPDKATSKPYDNMED